MRLIAEELGVSVSLVSRALSGKADQFRISKNTEQAILKAAKHYNYSPNRVARGLRLKRTNTLGLIVPNISNFFFSSIARRIERSARERGYSIILADSQDDEAVERKSVTILQESMADGIIIAPCGMKCDHLVSVAAGNYPIICVDGYFPDTDLPYVISDHRGGALIATRHLLENGHRQIALIQGYPEIQVSFDRLAGFRAAFEEFGLDLNAEYIIGEQFTYESGYAAAEELLSRSDPPTGMFAVNNEIALGALHAIEDRGLSVPADISVVAFDDLPWMPHLRIPLTTIAQDYEQLGSKVVHLLDAQIKGQTEHQGAGMTVPTYLVERGSVRNIAVSGRKPLAIKGS